MDDEDDARSQSLSQSQSQSQSPPPSPPPQAVSVASPAGPHPNGRAMAGPVTVATPPQRTLTLALPIQHPRPAAGGGGREDCWSEGATSALIDAWGERFLELSRGNLKQKQWQEVADAVSSRDDYTKPPKTDVQCKNRIDTLKKKYKLEKSKISGASPTSSWPFFHRLDLLIGPNLKPSPHQHHPPTTTTNNKAAATAAAMPILAPFPQRHRTHHPNHKKRSPSSSSSKPRGQSPDSSDSYPPETIKRRADPSSAAVRMRGLRELTQAILQFGEVYERVESSKLQQVMEMEKRRMGIARELELQRMEFFMKTQMELSQLKHHHHHHNNSSNHHGGSSSSKRKRNSGGTSNNNNINNISNTNSNSSN